MHFVLCKTGLHHVVPIVTYDVCSGRWNRETGARVRSRLALSVYLSLSLSLSLSRLHSSVDAACRTTVEHGCKLKHTTVLPLSLNKDLAVQGRIG